MQFSGVLISLKAPTDTLGANRSKASSEWPNNLLSTLFILRHGKKNPVRTNYSRNDKDYFVIIIIIIIILNK